MCRKSPTRLPTMMKTTCLAVAGCRPDHSVVCVVVNYLDTLLMFVYKAMCMDIRGDAYNCTVYACGMRADYSIVLTISADMASNTSLRADYSIVLTISADMASNTSFHALSSASLYRSPKMSDMASRMAAPIKAKYSVFTPYFR
jgi:hypothetical protein